MGAGADRRRSAPPQAGQLAAARRSGDQAASDRLRQRRVLSEGAVQSGSFVIANGSFVADEAPSRPRAGARQGAITAADQVIPDDLIVQGSGCFGFDASTTKLRLRHHRLKRTTSASSSRTLRSARSDQRLAADRQTNSASGGASKFSIEDITGSKVPFTVTAGAATNSIFVDSTGRVGFRTSTPVLDLHVNTSNTPSLRLEQNNSGGFTAQTWDVAGNEANFFIRDVTGGSRLPFRIRPGAPTSSVDISADGDVGIGTARSSCTSEAATARPSWPWRGQGTETNRRVSRCATTAASPSRSPTRSPCSAGASDERTSFLIDKQSNAGHRVHAQQHRHLTITGVYSPSDRNLKKNIVATADADILTRLAAMPVSFWSYKTDDYRHLGPMAQDFAAAFGLGINDTTINANDLAGVSLAATKALQSELQAKDGEIASLKQGLEALEAAVASLTGSSH